MCLWKPVAVGFIAGVGLEILLVGCAPLTPAEDAAAVASVPRIEARAAAVQSGCARIERLAPLANMIPEAGPAIALAAALGCGTASGVAGLVADPAGAERLARAEQALKAAVLRANLIR